MGITKTIWLRRLTAAILAGIWILLHLVKVLHHHHVPATVNPSYSHSANAVHELDLVGQSAASGITDCSICDFHLAKNADHTIAEYNVQHPSLIDTFFPGYYSSLLSAYSRSLNSRGPPAVV